MKIKYKRTLLSLSIGCLLAISSLAPSPAYGAGRPDYLKSVTYFGDEWPINYWSSEDRNMENHFAKIREDGFNSIILAVPWREFQPADASGEFNETAFHLLNQAMECAARHGLWVVLRIGYTWDYYGDPDIPDRFANITQKDSEDRQLWLRYSQKLYENASAHGNFHSAFMTWEDFWDFTYTPRRNLSEYLSVKLARDCGYSQYLEQHYSLEQLSRQYGTEFSDFGEIPLPDWKHPSAALFYEYYDQFLVELLAETQTVFPQLSMEVRLDDDLIYGEGEPYYYSHQATYPCEGADYCAIMYSVSMGQENKNDYIQAEQALKATEHKLESVYELSNKKLYAEQLLYADSTEEFSYNTQIEEHQVGEYVCSLAPILKKYTMGYGLWVYRNYVNNCVYNSQFALDFLGWEYSGDCAVTLQNGTPMAKLGKSGRLSQKLTGRLACRHSIQVEFFAEPSESHSNVTITLGKQIQNVPVREAGIYTLTFPWQNGYDLTMAADAPVLLDDIRVYTYEQYGRIYEKNGDEADLANDFRILNSQLP